MDRPDTGTSFFYGTEIELAPLADYAIQSNIGEGAHGVVLSAIHTTTNRKVAIKKVPFKQNQPSVTREVQALQECRGQYVVELLSYFTIPFWLTMIFECCLGDLSDIIATHGPLPPSHTKSYSVMMLQGLNHIHSLGWMHRDIKPSNMLITNDGSIRIADFGLARKVHAVTTDLVDGAESRLVDQVRPYSNQVASRWYRAPELLYGSHHYDSRVDIWAAGCIIAELIQGNPLFPGRSDIEQLALVHSALGTPTTTTWPELATLPDYGKLEFTTVPGVKMEHLVPKASIDAVKLLEGLITYSGRLRKTAQQALQYEYFANPPEPIPLHQLHLPSKKKPLDGESGPNGPVDIRRSNLDLRVIGVPMKLCQRNQ
ncbi:hypothetical protein SeMB42_g02243 [Synchytrium endobioticum]|uniref:cyclin-dependent kinase n=1 Tax=Synchytrium endobioticum TaxID=286115 RepID=A0A507DH11_9FUNG|nr:hypothetical protein SeMB42_g02243 [Synchytrium endobioticum]TPX50979.1 hypothetical protein SeLEV6574_g00556 [Synchytrium endobioticum]